MSFLSTLIIVVGLCSFQSSQPELPVQREFWQMYNNTQLYKFEDQKAYFFLIENFAVDADGAPDAYHPEDKGLEYLANSGYPDIKKWRHVLVTDPSDPDKPYIQKEGAYAGYFVSKTSLEDNTKEVTDPRRYVNANTIPYFVFPSSFLKLQGVGSIGDLCAAIHLASDVMSPFVVADIGPAGSELGEMSICLARNLSNKKVNPRTGSGVPEGKVLIILFPNSGKLYNWPLSNAEIRNMVNKLLIDSTVERCRWFMK